MATCDERLQQLSLLSFPHCWAPSQHLFFSTMLEWLCCGWSNSSHQSATSTCHETCHGETSMCDTPTLVFRLEKKSFQFILCVWPPETFVSSSTEIVCWPNGPSWVQLLLRYWLVSMTEPGIEPMTFWSLNCCWILTDVCALVCWNVMQAKYSDWA